MDQQVRWGIKDCFVVLFLVLLGSNLLALLAFPWLKTVSPLTNLVFGSVIQTTLILLLVFRVVFWRYEQGPESLGLKTAKLPQRLLEGSIWGILIFILVFLSGVIVSVFYPHVPPMQPFGRVIAGLGSGWKLLIPVLLGVILAPLGEELLFRGFFYPVLKRYLGVNWGMITSAFFFALMHLDPIRLIPLMAGSIALAWLYEKTGSLYTSMAAHATWNSLMILLLLLSQTQLT